MARRRGEQSGTVRRINGGWTGRYRVYREGKMPTGRSVFLGTHSQIPDKEEARRILRLVLKEENERARATEHLANAQHIIRPATIIQGGKHLPQVRGCVAEMQVVADLLCRGFEVFQPVHDFSSCDLVYLSEGRFVRVEVKSTTDTGDGPLRCDIRRNIGKFDVLACVLPDGSIQYRSHSFLGEVGASTEPQKYTDPSAANAQQI